MLKGAIGIVELSAIYKGFQVQDEMLKSANVEKVISRTICSGKYFIIVSGSVADVETAIDVGKKTAGFSLINATTIPNIDPKIFPALSGSTILENQNKKIDALLIIETFSVVSAIKAADFAVKEADLELIRIHVAMAVGGRGFVVITGNLSALEAAIQPAMDYCKQDGMLAGYAIIKNPHEDVLKELI